MCSPYWSRGAMTRANASSTDRPNGPGTAVGGAVSVMVVLLAGQLRADDVEQSPGEGEDADGQQDQLPAEHDLDRLDVQDVGDVAPDPDGVDDVQSQRQGDDEPQI